MFIEEVNMRYLVKNNLEFDDGRIIKKGTTINSNDEIKYGFIKNTIMSEDGYLINVDNLISIKEHRKNILRCL